MAQLRRYELNDADWAIIDPLLPRKSRGVARVEDRRVLNGIFWRLRSGSPWGDIPERYGPCTTCYNRFVRWLKSGIWDKLLQSGSGAFASSSLLLVPTHNCARYQADKTSNKALATSEVEAKNLSVAELCSTAGRAIVPRSSSRFCGRSNGLCKSTSTYWAAYWSS